MIHTVASFHGLKIQIADTSPIHRISQIVIKSLAEDLRTWRRQEQFQLNSCFWPDLFSSDRCSYLTHCNMLDKKCKETRLSWQLVCKKWFLLASPDYPRFEKLFQAGTKLLIQLSSAQNTG